MTQTTVSIDQVQRASDGRHQWTYLGSSVGADRIGSSFGLVRVVLLLVVVNSRVYCV